MKISPKLSQHQTQQQRIVMTPKLQQAIKVLMLPQFELSQYVEQEMEQNPLLEVEEQLDTALTSEDYDPSPDLNTPEKDIDRQDTEVDIDWHSVFDDLQTPTIKGNDNTSDQDLPEADVAETQSLQNYLNQQLQLAPFTETERKIGELIIGNLNDDGQLLMKLCSLPTEFVQDLERGIISTQLAATLLIKLNGTKDENKQNEDDNLSRFEIKVMNKLPHKDEDKVKTNCWELIDTKHNKTYTVKKEHSEIFIYVLTFEDISSEVGCTVSEVKTVLRRIQNSFDPIGIAYRDLKESLNIQIDYYEKQRFSFNGQSSCENVELLQLSRHIIEDHFEDLSKNRIMSISQALEVDKEKVRKASEWIRTLSPYPGRYFSDPTVKDLVYAQGSVHAIIPDVQIIEVDGEYQVFPMDDYIPRLRLNPYYVNMMRNDPKALDQETKKWIEQKYNDAADLLSSIAQRGRTIERVTEAIFEIQSDFLNDGSNTIKPLTLKTVADMAGVHESTVSRVTSNKYVQTPQGTYPLKYFFSNKLATTHGKSVSAKQVKAAIRELIRNEDTVKPLSDQAISSLLEDQGIMIARRTVQKYREELNILPSRQRKNTES